MTRPAVTVRNDWWHIFAVLPAWLFIAVILNGAVGGLLSIVQLILAFIYPIAIWKDGTYLRQIEHGWIPNRYKALFGGLLVALSMGLLSLVVSPYYLYKRRKGGRPTTEDAHRTSSSCSRCGQATAPTELREIRTDGGSAVQWCESCFYRGFKGTQKTSNDQSRANQHRSQQSSRRTSQSIACDGCSQKVSHSDATSAQLSDGSEVTCCPECYQQVQQRHASYPSNQTCANCSNVFDYELPLIELISGEEQYFCPNCQRELEQRGIVNSVNLTTDEAQRILGLAGDEDTKEINRQFREKVKIVHPDRETGSAEEFMRVQAARDTLLT